MSSVLARIIAKVRAISPRDWFGSAGESFRASVKELTGEEDVKSLIVEGAQRLAVGRVSVEHAQALRNYAEEEKLKLDGELLRRTLGAKQRQEDARADQEEIRTRTMRSEELLARLRMFDEYQKSDAIPIWDRQGNLRIVKAPASFDWDAARARLIAADQILGGHLDPDKPAT